MIREVYRATASLVSRKYRDDDCGSWCKREDPYIIDIMQGAPEQLGSIRKGAKLIAVRRGDPEYGDTWNEGNALVLVSPNGEQVLIYEENWHGDDMFELAGHTKKEPNL